MGKNMPYYDDDTVSLYEDKMILKVDPKRVINYSDVYYATFKRMGFFLFNPKKASAALDMKNGEYIKIRASLNGFYAFKRYYEKGKITDGKNNAKALSVLFIIVIAIVAALIIWFLSKLN